MITASSPSSTQNISYRGHIAELDAIRAIGIGIVLINHFWPAPLSIFVFEFGQTAWIAMDAFFVLSGFLITGILVDARSRPSYFRDYYTRRALRIFPLYYFLLLTVFILAHISSGGSGAEYTQLIHQWGSPAWFAFYLGNLKLAYVGKFRSIGAYGPLWTLQIEEQFYLLFPLAVRWLRVDHLTRLLWCMVILSPAFRILFYLWDPNNPFPQFVLLPCHMEGIALGALIALRIRRGPWQISKLRLTALTTGLLIATVAGSLSSVPLGSDEAVFSKFVRIAGISLSSWGCACLVLWLLVFRGSFYTRALRIAPVQYVAKISYGIYLLHQLASRSVRWTERFGIQLAPDGFPRFLLLVVMSLAMASVSWYLLERPLLRLKGRLTGKRQVDNILVRA